MRRLKTLLRYYFNLDRDKNDESEIIESVTRNITFRGTNLWTLFFAIIIASIGLNVNSTVALIGAMLISPLMGPVMGVGLGIGIADADLVRRGMKNLSIAVAVAIVTSTLYFRLTPLHNPTAELLAQTTPTIWDVMVALAGGMAGIIGATRREKTNVIPGVAIATALMPPLCTVGYGIATTQWSMIPGALYLFFINSVLICISTVIVIRFMGFRRRVYQSEERRRRVSAYIIVVAVVTIAPSIWLAYRIVQKAVFESAASSFVSAEFRRGNTQVVSKNFIFHDSKPRIELLLLGRELDAAEIDSLRNKLPAYKLAGTELIVRQGLNARQEIDFAQIRASIADELFRNRDSAALPQQAAFAQEPDLRADLKALFPEISAYSIAFTPVRRVDSIANKDTATMFMAKMNPALKKSERLRLQRFLETRLRRDSIVIVLQ